jgi:hypothetical protein
MSRWKILPETFQAWAWGGLRILEPNPADEDDSLSETCSGEGESLVFQ